MVAAVKECACELAYELHYAQTLHTTLESLRISHTMLRLQSPPPQLVGAVAIAVSV